MGKSDRTEERAVIRTAEKSKHTGKVTPLSAGKQATAKTDGKEKVNGQRTMRKVEQKTFVIDKAWRFSLLKLFNYALYYDHYIEFFRLI